MAPRMQPAGPHRAGQSAPESGIYRVRHHQHRGSHEVTIFAGDLFPLCQKCGDHVTYELVRPVMLPGQEDDFDNHA